MCFTCVALSNHWRTFSGFAFICDSKSPYIERFSFAEFAVVRFRLSSTKEKPSSTSDETFSASIAIKTTYIKLIIFWRGDTGLFLIAIAYYIFFMFTVMASIIR